MTRPSQSSLDLIRGPLGCCSACHARLDPAAEGDCLLHRVWQPGSGQQLTLYTVSGAVANKAVRSQAAALEQLRHHSTSGEPEPASAGVSESEHAGAAVNGSYAEDADNSTDEKVDIMPTATSVIPSSGSLPEGLCTHYYLPDLSQGISTRMSLP